MAIGNERRGVGIGRSPLRQFHCVQCGYGAVRSIAPERCPMCAGTVWECTVRPFRGDWITDTPLARETSA